ncbi:MAG: beta-galactosidase trimerization domain-containing protein, partial [Anaerolineae bacterium]|nr:beta-galactosidase trimerization domain-containing protein [Anaerolineae bacterium]
YQNDYVRDIVGEIVARYDLDCIKFGGGSFGFSRDICYCPNCRQSFLEHTGHDLPLHSDWADPVWRAYTGWRLDQARQRVHALGDVVHSVDPELPFMGNSVCFGDPGWTVGASLDVENQASVEDAVQVEVQTRARYDEAAGSPVGEATWQYLSWPAETARFMTSVSDKPIWVVASYFLAWPWRRSAMAPVEQKVYLAQIAANGADPMVNLSGGPPAVHEDPRGFDVIRDLYGFLDEHQEYYAGDASGANVALVYSLETLVFYGQDDPDKRYVREIRGIEQALHEAHIPFDIISTRVLDERTLSRYRVLVLPTLACMSKAESAAIEAFVAQGGSVVATFETSLYDREGVRRDQPLLGSLLGVRIAGPTRSSMACADPDCKPGYAQVYMQVADQHPVLDGLAGTSVLPMGGRMCEVVADAGTRVPLTLSAPFIVFPEGFSYPEVPASNDPLLVIKEHATGGRTLYFAGSLGTLAWTVPYPDLQRLIANAVRWAAGDALPISVDGPSTLQVSLRVQPGRRLVHLINLTGGERFFSELVPLHDIVVRLPASEPARPCAFLLSDRRDLEVVLVDGAWQVTVPKLTDYDVLVFELNA